MSETKERPIGSGYFSLVVGIVFFLLFVGTWCRLTDLTQVEPKTIFRAWLLFAAVILMFWGAVRIAKIRRVLSKKWVNLQIGQETLNFVIGIIAATAAILTLVVEHYDKLSNKVP